MNHVLWKFTRLAKSAALVLLLLSRPHAEAETVSLDAIQDVTIYSNLSQDEANGAGPSFFTGITGEGYATRALIQFDPSSIPAGAVINNVALNLHMDRTNAVASVVSLHQVTNAWNEGPSLPTGGAGGGGSGGPAQLGDTTWAHTFFPTQFWNLPGGDFDPLPSAMMQVGGVGFYTWGSTAAMVADVQQWIDNPQSNFGWILKGQEASAISAKRFQSRTASNPNYRPLLVIDYTLSPSCPCDLDGVPGIQVQDIFAFLSLWFAGDSRADFDNNSLIEVADIFAFLACWFSGCY